jgi:hemerythrin-like domain-containing protein
VEQGQKVEAEIIRDIASFMRTFADKCHHGKEETHLFPLLGKKGVPVQGCPVGALTREHQEGRKLVGQLAETATAYAQDSAAAKDRLVATLRALIELYPNHIWKEDYLLFPMTDKILSPGEQEELAEKFERVEAEIGEQVHHEFEELAEKLGQIRG